MEPGTRLGVNAVAEVVPPTITVRLRATGAPGHYKPTIEVRDMPGDWEFVFQALLGALRLAHVECLREVREGDARITVAKTAPRWETR